MRGDKQAEESLDVCLKIQPLQCPSTVSSSGHTHSSSSIASSKNGLSGGEARPRQGSLLKRKGVKREPDAAAATRLSTRHHHPPPPQSINPDLHGYGLPVVGNPPSYFSPPHTTHAAAAAAVVSQMQSAANPHHAMSSSSSSSPSCPPPPPAAGHPYSPPTHHPGGHGFPMSPKMAASAAGTYPSAQSSPASCVYNSDPGSPMQTTFSPAQAPAAAAAAAAMILSSAASIYTQCNGGDVMPPPLPPPLPPPPPLPSTTMTTYALGHASLASATPIQAEYLPSSSHLPISEAAAGGYCDNGATGYSLVSVNGNILPASLSADFPPQPLLPVPVFPGNRQATDTDISSM